MSRTPQQWHDILVMSGVKEPVAQLWASTCAKYLNGVFNSNDIELADFLAQALYETKKLAKLEEDLSYSPQRLCVVWPSRFPGVGDALPYAWKPQALANKVYGGRMGNNLANDGWTYRGRGIPQITGKANYAQVGKAIGMDLIAHPELLAEPEAALAAALAWWHINIPNDAIGDVERITQRVNGSDDTVEARQAITDTVTKALEANP